MCFIKLTNIFFLTSCKILIQKINNFPSEHLYYCNTLLVHKKERKTFWDLISKATKKKESETQERFIWKEFLEWNLFVFIDLWIYEFSQIINMNLYYWGFAFWSWVKCTIMKVVLFYWTTYSHIWLLKKRTTLTHFVGNT